MARTRPVISRAAEAALDLGEGHAHDHGPAVGTVGVDLHLVHRLQERPGARLVQQIARAHHRVAGHRRQHALDAGPDGLRAAVLEEVVEDLPSSRSGSWYVRAPRPNSAT